MTIRSIFAFLHLKAGVTQYLFKHTPNYTKIYGNDWTLFAIDYGLKAGDIIDISHGNCGLDFEVDAYRQGEMLPPLPHVGKTTQVYFIRIFFYRTALISNFYL